MNDYVTIKEAAVLANRAPRKIYEWVQNGRLPARKDEYTSPDTNPNSQVALAQWVSDEIADILHPPRGDE